MVDELHVGPCFDARPLRTCRVAVAVAVDERDLIAEETVRDATERMHAPVGRVAEFRPIDQRLLEVAIAIVVLEEWDPRRIADASAHGELGVDFACTKPFLTNTSYLPALSPISVTNVALMILFSVKSMPR